MACGNARSCRSDQADQVSIRSGLRPGDIGCERTAWPHSSPFRLLDLFSGVGINVETSCRPRAVEQEAAHENEGDDEPKQRAVHWNDPIS